MSNAAVCPAVRVRPPAFFRGLAADLSYDALVAPLTFVTILAKYVQLDFFRRRRGHGTMQSVRSIASFVFPKPVLAETSCGLRMDIHSVDEQFRRRHRRYQETLHQATTVSWSWRAYALMGQQE